MSIVNQYKMKVLEGNLLTRNEVRSLSEEKTIDLMVAADEIRKMLCGYEFSLCTIVNGKSGKCTEDCKYCAQSAHYNTNVDEYNILDSDEILDKAISSYNKGVQRFSIVTSGRSLKPSELDNLCKVYNYIKENCYIELCASHGLLKYEELKQLKSVGVTRYHCNLETSERFFSSICTTHTFAEKVETIKNAKKAGLEVCSGGIIGLGEKIEDRIEMAFALNELEVNNVPVNILNPIKGTALENQQLLEY